MNMLNQILYSLLIVLVVAFGSGLFVLVLNYGRRRYVVRALSWLEAKTWYRDENGLGLSYWPSLTDWLGRASHRLDVYSWKGLFGRGFWIWHDHYRAELNIYDWKKED